MGLRVSKDKHGVMVAYDSDIPDLGATRRTKDGGHFRYRQDPPLKHDHSAGLTYRATQKTAAAAERFLQDLCNDPVRFGMLRLEANRPAGVSKERFGVAVRKAAREPMINADPHQTTRGLDFKSSEQKYKHATYGDDVGRIIVKPTSSITARHGRTAGFWGERVWTIRRLKYSNGYILTTDLGEDSKPFNSIGQMRKAITASGWEIIR